MTDFDHEDRRQLALVPIVASNAKRKPMTADSERVSAIDNATDSSAMSRSLNHDYPQMTPYGAKYVKPQGAASTVSSYAREAIRLYGQATASLRVKPDYLVIGTKRGGTTSMARWLLDHPDVLSLFPARETRKGTYYFDVNYGRGERWYRSHFPTRSALQRTATKTGRHTIVGEATPYYLHHPHAAIRARRFAPETKVIVLLRDPVDRAYGHWMERTRNGVETLSFGDAIAAEEERLAGEEERMLEDPAYASFAHQHFSYVDQGRYQRGLARWVKAFGPNQLMIIRSEDMYADPSKIYGQVLNFLGLAPHEPEAFSAWNLKPKDKLDPAIEASLRATFSRDIVELETLIGRAMEWN